MTRNGKPTANSVAVTDRGRRYTATRTQRVHEHPVREDRLAREPGGVAVRNWVLDSVGRPTQLVESDNPDAGYSLAGHHSGDRLVSRVDRTTYRTTNWGYDTPEPCRGHRPLSRERRAVVYSTSYVYDQNMTGLAATYWANTTMSGAPYAHDTTSGANWYRRARRRAHVGQLVCGLPATGPQRHCRWISPATCAPMSTTGSCLTGGPTTPPQSDRLIWAWGRGRTGCASSTSPALPGRG